MRINNVCFRSNKIIFQQPKNKMTLPQKQLMTDTVSFAGMEEDNEKFWNWLYDTSVKKHKYSIATTKPENVERYFYHQNIPASFNKGDKITRQFIAFSCLNASEIYKSINCIRPSKITMEHFDDADTIGCCYWGPERKKNYPVRTVVFNADIDLDKMVEIGKNDFSESFHPSKHFLQPFLHEFAHNLHYHKLYSKWGCPFENQGYRHNPDTLIKMKILGMSLKDEYGNPINPFVDTKVYDAITGSSGYGQTKLVETFAEEFSGALINEMNLFTLRLERNPLPIKISNPVLNSILFEVWEGLVDDGRGFVK